MYDALLGPGRWVYREGVGGTIPVRFPNTKDPGHAGCTSTAATTLRAKYWVNVHVARRILITIKADVVDAHFTRLNTIHDLLKVWIFDLQSVMDQ